MNIVSVITTVFNCNRFIQESLESIANQSFQNFEWIIINDGSTDDTWEKILSFKHPNIVLVDNKDNKKIPIRRNEAIEMSKGKYIAIHDGDDISLKDRLNFQINYFNDNPEIFCLGGWAIQIDENSVEQRLMQYPPLKSEEIIKMFLHQRRNPIIDPTCMFRKDVFLSLGKYTLDKSIYTVPDMDLWARAIVNGYKFANLPKCLIKYRINPDGMTRKYNKDMINAHHVVWRRFCREMNKMTAKTRG